MSILNKTVAVLACSAGLLGIGSTVAATQASATATRSTQGFTISNLSGDTLTLKNIANAQGLELAPKTGSQLLPGGQATFEVKWVSYFDQATVRYVDAKGQALDVKMTVEAGGIPSSKCELAQGHECSASRKSIVVTDLANTRHELYGAQSRNQAQIVQNLCRDKGPATCDFAVESQDDEAYGPQTIADAYENAGEESAPMDVDKMTSVKNENSFDISVEVGTELEAFGQKIDTKIKTAWGHKWTNTEEVRIKHAGDVPGGRVGYIWYSAPVLRTVGTLSMTFANTTYVLHDIQFDTPDGSRHTISGFFDGPISVKPLTPGHQR